MPTDATHATAHRHSPRVPTPHDLARTSPAPATLRHFRVVSFEVHFDWLFLFFEALAVLLLARRGFEKHEGDPRQSKEAFSTLHPLPAVFGAGSSSPRHCPGVPTM